jgi:hypothetical protein
MIPPSERRARRLRMEEARRQTQYQLDIIDRQIIRRMTALIPAMKPKRTAYRGGKPPDPSAFLDAIVQVSRRSRPSGSPR